MAVSMPVSPGVLSVSQDVGDPQLGFGGAEAIQIGGKLDPAVFQRWISASLLLADRKLMKRVSHVCHYDEATDLLTDQEPSETPEDVEITWTTSSRARYVHLIIRYQAVAGKASPPALAATLIRHSDDVEIDPGWSITPDAIDPATGGQNVSFDPKNLSTGWTLTPGANPLALARTRPLAILDQQDTVVRLVLSGTYVRILSVDIQEFGDRAEEPTFTPTGEV